MKRIISCLALLIVGGCSGSDTDAVPATDYVDLIERKLANHPCVGDLGLWERSYRFARPNGFSAYTKHADIDVVEFHLRRAETVTIVPGRTVMRRDGHDDWPEAKSIRAIDGRYKMGSGSLQIAPCARLPTRPQPTS